MKKISVLILAICVLVFSLSSLVFAQEEQELLQSAMNSIEASDFILAQKTLDQLQFILWNKSPMIIENATFTEGETHAYGVFNKRVSNVFGLDETIYVYAEPKYFTLTKQDEQYVIFLILDFNLYDKAGNLLISREAFSQYQYSTKKTVREIFVDLYFNLKIDPGEYQLEVVFHDQSSDKTASFKLPFQKQQKS
ncbi:hypothetical protein [Atribacter laminatus]|jgi:hypothetical protein|uniref:Uncharacterized protein n=1 Tax=Atribacter laminatus TaxID=2847778 RepID=A0A7T1F406_ATRLM|nr:hypothetical protein [Atribacter laminatus]QPM69422.1 hypothetical protein RT761_02655 [Atribacter laminatus]